jgi:hypothetical protein
LSSKSISLCPNSSYNDYNVASEDDSQHVFPKEGTSTIVLLPNQVALMKKLLQETIDKEEEFNPKMATLGERVTHWQHKVQKLFHNHANRVMSTEEEE